jgi:hypothetical protein
MSLVTNFTTVNGLPNQINLSWNQPVGFNTSNSEIIVTRTDTYFPCELFNPVFPTKATDPIPIPIFTGTTITGSTTSISGMVVTDSSAAFPTSPPLNGRIYRDSSGNIFTILSNTATTVTLDGTPTPGVYVILADFPSVIQPQQTYEKDIRTTSAPGSITNLVQLINGNLTVVTFTPDQVVNLIFQDAAGNKFVVQTNNLNTLYFYQTTVTPVIGIGMTLLSSATNERTIVYVDDFETRAQAAARIGTGLLDDQFYYYTAFVIPIGANVAQADFATYETAQSTQDVALSVKNLDFGTVLYNYWPTLFRQLDATGDLQDLMNVFGYQMAEIHSLITTFNLQDSDNVYVSALAALADQTGLPSVSYSIGIDTFRRIARNMITAWKLKGSKLGIALFIRILTTWDILGTEIEINNAISDFLPNASAFRFFAPNLGTANTRFSQSNSVPSTNSSGVTTITETGPFVPGGRFAKSLPGIIIPGFFTYREFVITIPSVALFVGTTTAFSVSNGTTTVTDSTANFGPTNGLVGNFIISNQSEPNDSYEIISNTSTSVTVNSIIIDRVPQNSYAILSPLNNRRFATLIGLMPLYQPFGTLAGYIFT